MRSNGKGVKTCHGRNRCEGELSERGVVLAVDTLTLEDGELNGLLVVFNRVSMIPVEGISGELTGNGGEGPLLDSGDGLTTGNDGGEDVTLHGYTKGEGNDIKKEEVGSVGGGGLSGKDTGLDGGTVGNGLIGVDALLELLAVEVVAEELLDLGDTGGTTNKDDLVNLVLGKSGVLENLGNGVQSASEGLLVQVLETSTGNVGVEVLTVEQRVDLNSGLGGVGESTLGTLASSPETTKGTGVTADVLGNVSILQTTLSRILRGSVSPS